MAINAEQLNIILSARDKEFTKAMERNQRRVERFARQSQKDLSRTGKAFDQLSKTAKVAGAAMAAAAVAGFVKVARDALSAAEAISDTANATNATVEGLQKLRFAADQNGLSAKQMDDALLRLTRRMSMFVQDGGGPAAKAIEQLGLNVRDAEGNMRSSDVVFADIADRLATMDDKAQAAALASQLFGDRVGPQLVPLLSQGREGIKQFGDEADRLGIVLDETGVRKAAAANAKLRALGDSMKNELYSVVLDNVDAIEDLAEGMSAVIGVVADAVAEVVRLASGLGDVYDNARAVLGLASRGSTGATYGSRTGIMQELYGLTPRQAARRAGEMIPGEDLLPPVSPLAGMRPRAVETAGPGRTINAQPPGFVSGGVTFGNVVTGDDITNTPEGREALGLAPRRGGGGGVDQVEQLRRAYMQLISALDETEAMTKEYNQRQDTLNDALASGAITSEEHAHGMDLVAQAYRDAQFEASGLDEVMQTVESSMEDAFMSMIDGTNSAKDAFRAMAQDIIRELYRVLVVQQLVGQFQTGGGGILGALAPMFGRASGGPVMAGRAYTVGEHGREPFIPAENGRILSTAQAKDAMSGGGGGNITVNYTFQGGVTEADLARALPALVDGTKQAVIDAVQRGGATARAFK